MHLLRLEDCDVITMRTQPQKSDNFQLFLSYQKEFKILPIDIVDKVVVLLEREIQNFSVFLNVYKFRKSIRAFVIM